VRFLEAVQAAAAVSADYVAEAGPRPTLLRLIRRCGLPQTIRSLSLCSGPDSDGTELISAAASVMRDGHPMDLTAIYGGPTAGLQRVPPYEFDAGNRYWFDVPVLRPTVDPEPGSAAPVTDDQVQQGPGGAVLAVIADVGGYSVSELTRGSLLSDDLGYDSLLQLRLVDRLRSKYPELEGVDVAEVIPNIHTVGDLVDFVTTRLAPDPAGAVR
jgi:acyl transferase domain-containing protein